MILPIFPDLLISFDTMRMHEFIGFQILILLLTKIITKVTCMGYLFILDSYIALEPFPKVYRKSWPFGQSQNIVKHLIPPTLISFLSKARKKQIVKPCGSFGRRNERLKQNYQQQARNSIIPLENYLGPLRDTITIGLKGPITRTDLSL